MPRNISDEFRSAFSAETTGETALISLTITHPTLSVPVRLILDTAPHGFGVSSTSTTLYETIASSATGLESFRVADHANFSGPVAEALGDNVRVEETGTTSWNTSGTTTVAGATTVVLDGVTGLAPHDFVKIGLDNGTSDYRKIVSIAGSSILIDEGLSSASTSDAVYRITYSYGRVSTLTNDGTADVITFVKPFDRAFVGSSTGAKVWKMNQYLPFPFEIEMGSDEPGQFNGAALKIDNIDRAILSAFREITPSMETPEVVIRVVLASSPERVEFETPPLGWARLEYNNLFLSGVLTAPTFFGRAYPAQHYTPTAFPNLFSV